jgi:hypothetical protein
MSARTFAEYLAQSAEEAEEYSRQGKPSRMEFASVPKKNISSGEDAHACVPGTCLTWCEWESLHEEGAF